LYLESAGTSRGVARQGFRTFDNENGPWCGAAGRTSAWSRRVTAALRAARALARDQDSPENTAGIGPSASGWP